MQHPQSFPVFLALATVAQLGVAMPAWAGECNENNCPPGGCNVTGQDCNDNGVDDAVDIVNQFSEDCNLNRIPDECEFPQCAPIDVAFLFDTSGSMGVGHPPLIDNVCDRVDAVIAQLNAEGLCVRSEIREIFEGGEIDCPCCDDDPANVMYGTTTEGLPEVLGDGCLSPEEDWGPATAIVAGEKEWTPGPRIIVPISDEGPRCGYRLDGEDQAVIDHAIPIVWCNRVTVVPVTLTRDGDLKALAQALADGGAPQGRVLNIESYDLAEELADVIRSVCPEDCNENDIIDACDISEGTSLDCDQDGVPDECHLAGYLDCQDPPNGNGIPDPCDLNCGPVMGDCAHWPGCGQSTDCDNNCVPDDCEWDFVDCHEPGQPGYGTLDLCDIAEGTSPDCFQYESICCVPRPEPGCDNPFVDENCVCVPYPNCCDEEHGGWSQACVDLMLLFQCPANEAGDEVVCLDNPDGVPDECQASPDCNENLTPDAQDLASGTSPDCNGNCIPDECDIADGTSEDCNNNGIPDECDLGEGASCDMNEDGVPDECFACCLPSGEDFTCENRTPTYCETGGGHTAEVGVCEAWIEPCELRACCILEDCVKQTHLACDRDGGYFVRGVVQCGAGTCDVGACCTTGCLDGYTRAHCDNHGGIYRGGADCSDDPYPCAVPEPWECPEAPIPYPKWDPQFCPDPFGCYVDGYCSDGVCMCEYDAHCLGEVETSCIDGFCYVNVHKNRYLSFIPGNLGKLTALRVTLTYSEKFDDPDVIGRQWWVGEPEGFSENSGTRMPPSTADWPTFWAAQLTCEQHFVDWTTVLGCGAPLYVYGPQIIPHATYQVQALGPHCSPDDRRNLSAPLTIATGLWGDISMGQDEITLSWEPPDWRTTALVDVMAVLDKFRNLPNAPIKALCDLSPPIWVGDDQQTPNQLVDLYEATNVLEAVRQNSPENPFVFYPFDEPPECE